MNDQVELHLRECEECRETADRWEPFEAALREDAANRAPARPTAGEISALVAAARSRREPAGARVIALRWAGGIAALVLIGVAVVLLARPGVTVAPAAEPKAASAVEVELHRAARVDVVTMSGGMIEAPADGRAVARLGTDRLELGAGGRIELLELGKRTRLGRIRKLEVGRTRLGHQRRVDRCLAGESGTKKEDEDKNQCQSSHNRTGQSDGPLPASRFLTSQNRETSAKQGRRHDNSRHRPSRPGTFETSEMVEDKDQTASKHPCEKRRKSSQKAKADKHRRADDEHLDREHQHGQKRP